MISRSRSAPTAAAMSIECTTSANSTVTCLYSADRLTRATGAPHSLQNLELGGSSVPHDPHDSPAAVSAPRLSPAPSTLVSFHRCSAMSVISPGHLRDEVSRPSYVVYSATTDPTRDRTERFTCLRFVHPGMLHEKSHPKCPIGHMLAKSNEKWTSNLRTYTWSLRIYTTYIHHHHHHLMYVLKLRVQ